MQLIRMEAVPGNIEDNEQEAQEHYDRGAHQQAGAGDMLQMGVKMFMRLAIVKLLELEFNKLNCLILQRLQQKSHA